MTFSVREQSVVVIGAGRSGRAAATLLASRGARVTLTDPIAAAFEDADALLSRGIRLDIAPHRADVLEAADLIVLSPGVPPGDPAIASAKRAGVPVIGEIELAFRWLRGRVVAITGTKGKSTTTTLTARMLKEGGFNVTAGGNLGTALSTQVDASAPEAIHVVEVSSFQLETTDTFRPWISVLLNLSPDHLDRHPSLDEYAAAKARVFMNQTADDWAVINADDPGVLAMARAARAHRLDFALDAAIEEGVTVSNDQIVRRSARIDVPLLPLSSVRLPGRHLLADVLAAAAVSSLVGVAPAAMRRAVEQFNGLEHALERVAEVAGVLFVNDSKATNVISAKRAIESFSDGVVAIMGGRYKGGSFEELRDVVPRRVRAVVAIGEAGGRIREALEDLVPVDEAPSMQEAVERAFALAAPRGVVLLAPGCASFDMFRDYADRGREFKAAVRAVEARQGRA